jgi:hypothetical protein
MRRAEIDERRLSLPVVGKLRAAYLTAYRRLLAYVIHRIGRIERIAGLRRRSYEAIQQ